MGGFPVLPRCYVFAMGIFAAFPSHSRGKTLPCIAHYVFNSQVHLEHISSSFLKLTSLCPRFSWKAFSQGSIGGLFYVNFMIDQFSYLNITSIGRNLIQDENDCGYACLEIPSCFSYNVAAFPDVNNKLRILFTSNTKEKKNKTRVSSLEVYVSKRHLSNFYL